MITHTKSLTHFLTTWWFDARVRLRAGAAGVRDLPARGTDFRLIGATLLLIMLTAMLAVPAEVEGVEWAQTYSGEARDEAHDVIETTDYGYLVAGSTRSFGAAEEDAWVLKLDAQGAVQGERRYGGPADDVANCVREVPGGYLLAGSTASFGAGKKDAWLVKLDMLGNVVWEKSYGGLEDEEMGCVEITDNGAGDYVFAATSWSFESGGYPEFAYSHVWLVKVDKNTGNVIWQRAYALSPHDFAHSIEETADGGFIVGATTNAPGLGNHDFWVLKLDENGIIEWQKAYGQNEFVPADPWFHYQEWYAYVRQTSDGGYILAGTSVSTNTSTAASWTVKLDPDGVIEWNRWGGVPYVTGVRQLNNGEYAVLGRTGWPTPSSFEDPHQARLIKFDTTGYVPWEGTYTRDPAKDDEFAGFMQTRDDGFIVAGGTGLGYESGDAWVLKLDASGMASTDCEAIEIDNSGYSPPASLNALTVNTAAIVTDTGVFVADTTATVEGTSAYTSSGCDIIVPDLIDLAKTGQTLSDVPGDDGDLQMGVAWPDPRFVDNGDGTLTDMLTGLVWLQDANCAASSGYDDDGLILWAQVFDFIDALNQGTVDTTACGYTGRYEDWRQPNIVELSSLVHWQNNDMAGWLSNQGFSNVQAMRYWSSTRYPRTDVNESWFIQFSGGMNGHLRLSSKSYTWPVRAGEGPRADPAYPANPWQTGVVEDDPAVVGDDGELQAGVAWPVPRFFDQDDGTVIDGLTGLMWLKDATCLEGPYNWWNAIDAVQSLNDGSIAHLCEQYTAEYSDWRMPNMLELTSMVNWSKWIYALPSPAFIWDLGGILWTSSSGPSAEPLSNAWALNCADGQSGSYSKTWSITPQPFRVWPVRTPDPPGPLPDIKANGSDGPLQIVFGTPLQVDVSLSANDAVGQAADWWLAAEAPDGRYWYDISGSWVKSAVPIPTYEGPLFDLAPMTVLNNSNLPVGSYRISFGVDSSANGVLDFDVLIVDTVDVTIQ